MVQPNVRTYVVCVSNNAASRVAVKIACIKAKNHGGQVKVVHVIPPTDGQTLFMVADRLKNEMRTESEHYIQEMCDAAFSMTGLMPSVDIREGHVGDQILKAASEDDNSILMVFGMEKGANGDLIEWLSEQMGSKIFIPMMIVPGNLTDERIREII